MHVDACVQQPDLVMTLRLVQVNTNADAHNELCRKEQSVAIRGDYVPALLQGIASHHAGCLPGWRCLIELLFQRGML